MGSRSPASSFTPPALTIAVLLASIPVTAAPESNPSTPEEAERSWRLIVELDPPYFASGGAGGALGIELGQVALSLAAFGVPLPPMVRDMVFDGADHLEVPLNAALEVVFDYYLRPDMQGLFLGLLGSLDLFEIRAKGTSEQESLYAFYTAPRIGWRWTFLGDWLYVKPSAGLAVRVAGAGEGTLAGQSYRLRAVVPLLFLSAGVRL